MRVELTVNAEKPLQLAEAVLLYRNDKRSIATLHRCAIVNGRPTVLAGRPMTTSMSRRIARSLISPSFQPLQLLPATLLAASESTLIWYEPPQMRSLAFKQSTQFPERSIGDRVGRVPTPGVVFVARPGTLSIFAYRGHARPEADTVLHHAPFFNVYASGSVCMGNVSLPRTVAISTMAAWSRAFFSSYFVHANDTEMVDFEGEAVGLWRHLLDHPGDPFPELSLVPTKLTLATLLSRTGVST